MRLSKWMLRLSIAPMFAAICACSTLRPVEIAQIPLRPELTRCEVLTPMPPEALPALDADRHTQEVQLRERGAWMGRDMAQANLVSDLCHRQAELVGLIQANNAGPQH